MHWGMYACTRVCQIEGRYLVTSERCVSGKVLRVFLKTGKDGQGISRIYLLSPRFRRPPRICNPQLHRYLSLTRHEHTTLRVPRRWLPSPSRNTMPPLSRTTSAARPHTRFAKTITCSFDQCPRPSSSPSSYTCAG